MDKLKSPARSKINFEQGKHFLMGGLFGAILAVIGFVSTQLVEATLGTETVIKIGEFSMPFLLGFLTALFWAQYTLKPSFKALAKKQIDQSS